MAVTSDLYGATPAQGADRPRMHHAMRAGEYVMPMLNQASAILSTKMSQANISATAAAEAHSFAALPLPADVVYPNNPARRAKLQAYLDALPPGIQESIRATIYFALKSNPPKPVAFAWRGGYDYRLEMDETYDAGPTVGTIGITLVGRYPDDPHPILAAVAHAGSGKSSSKRAARGAPRPAKRRASKRS